MQISRQEMEMCATVKSYNVRDMTKEMEQAEMRLKTFMLRTVTLPLSFNIKCGRWKYKWSK